MNRVSGERVGWGGSHCLPGCCLLTGELPRVREKCDTVANADVNGAENIRQKVLPSLATDGGDRDNGWLAQPAVRLFDRSEGSFAPREQVVNREP